ncbi:MAG TPA: DUF763 domain-containing protein [Candidatus Paceibacterota bacterium]|nr:DUF763 domain-containing protein [Candidatus Paceibacterota bacterium]
MVKRGIATFGLDTGVCPPWLFERMVKLSREMIQIMVELYGPDEFIRRVSEPGWFQSLGTVLAFDWNASGLTTILTAALKEALSGLEKELGIFICGGKGKTSRKTPQEIENWGAVLTLPSPAVQNLVYNSKMSAKVDSSLVQDGYQLYHHAFFFSRNGHWSVVQQGMNQDTRMARRYHWYSKNIKDLVVEPHSGISSPLSTSPILNLSAEKSKPTQDLSIELANGNYQSLLKDVELLRRHSTPFSRYLKLQIKNQTEPLDLIWLGKKEPYVHSVIFEDFSRSKYLERILYKVNEQKPENYEKLVSLEGVGPKTVRALSLVSEVIYGAKPSYEDPARYSFAHGGKDKIPYPVDRPTYDETITFFRKVIKQMKLPFYEKNALEKKLVDRN